MGLNPPAAGLRRVGNTTKSAAKAQLVVQPGDELVVSDDVANQLIGARVGITDLDAPQRPLPAPGAADGAPSAAEASVAAESAELEDQGAVVVPPELATIDEVLAWVDGDPARARAALAAEQGGKKRKGLLGQLGDLMADAG
jgi:hypothetical protein